MITIYHSVILPLEDYFKTSKKIRITIESETKAILVDFDFSTMPRKIKIVNKVGFNSNGKLYKWVEKAIDEADERLCKAFNDAQAG